MLTYPLHQSFVRHSKYLAYAVIMIALSVIVGWQFDIDTIKRVIPGLVAMNPLTSICFILSGVSFLLFASNNPNSLLWARTIALVVAAMGLVKIVGMSLGVENNIDKILYHAKLQSDVVADIPNSMAPNTAWGFIVTGIALALLPFETKYGKRISEYLAIIILLISLFSVVGYIYGVSFYYRVLAFIPMALHTALCFLFISISILFSHPHKGMMAELTTHHAGGKLARRLLLPIFLTPILLGWLSLFGKRTLLFDSEFAAATFTIGVTILLVVVTWLAVKSLNKADRQRDITESKLANTNEELLAQTEQLEALNLELESFSYSISHDLRAPLRSIAGYSKILEEDYYNTLDEDGRKILHTILRSTTKMNQLIDGLLGLSKLEREKIKKSSIDMQILAQSTINELCNSSTSGISIEVDPLPSARADQIMMSLVYQNLISNAIKYSSKKESPTIRIGAQKINGEIVYFVKDNGAGFDMNYYDKLFGVFQRLHSESEFEGTGIGLATVNRIVQKHGGRIWAEGKINEGSVFYFTLGQ